MSFYYENILQKITYLEEELNTTSINIQSLSSLNKNLTLDDLLAAKAFAEITNCEPRVIDDINSALGRL